MFASLPTPPRATMTPTMPSTTTRTDSASTIGTPLPRPTHRSSSSSSSHVVLVSDTAANDGSFLLHHFSGFYLSPRFAASATSAPASAFSKRSSLTTHPDASSPPAAVVVVLGLNQTQTHFEAVAKKLGYSPRQQNPPRFRFLDGFSHLDTLAGGPFAPPPKKADSAPTSTARSHLANAYRNIRAAVTELDEAAKASGGGGGDVCIVVDDLSVLIYLGVELREVMRFVVALSRFVRKRGGTLAVRVHADATTVPDVEQEALVEALLQLADYRIHVQGLASGFSDGVTGQLTVQRGPWWMDAPDGEGSHPEAGGATSSTSSWNGSSSSSTSSKIRDASYLYDIGDASSVRLFAPGLK
ncbi:hypothetical protein DFJ73DRAFT_797576 [Zopfochytrium polystomum]|nr:hypothetical protein DFJ73DRAFT_797576 [Zopfochytrium polystomum]